MRSCEARLRFSRLLLFQMVLACRFEPVASESKLTPPLMSDTFEGDFCCLKDFYLVAAAYLSRVGLVEFKNLVT